MIATPQPGPNGLPDRRTPGRRRRIKTHSALVRGHGCHGQTSNVGTHSVRVRAVGRVPIAHQFDCTLCGDRIAVGIWDGRILWTESKAQRQAEAVGAARDGRQGGGTARQKGER